MGAVQRPNTGDDGASTARPRRATIAEVANRAGVSKMTVSRVANGSARVSSQTRNAVLAAIDELGYIPNRVARGLTGQRLGLLAVIVPDLENPFFTRIVRSVEDVANANGRTVILGNSDEQLQREAAYLEAFAALQVDGVLLGATGDASAPYVARVQRAGVPVVLIDRRVPGIQADVVVGAAMEPARFLTEHLLDHGHVRIGMVAGPSSASTSRDREAGYRQALADRGLQPSADLVQGEGFTRAAGLAAGRALLRRADRPSAVVAANSFLAFGVIAAARELGLEVPDDLAVVSFDDYEITAGEPFLTCADQPAADIAQAATRLLLERIAGADGLPRTVVVGTELRVRTSCGCAPRAGSST